MSHCPDSVIIQFAFLPVLNLLVLLRTNWPMDITFDNVDYHESLHQQFLENINQKREYPWYSLILGALP